MFMLWLQLIGLFRLYLYNNETFFNCINVDLLIITLLNDISHFCNNYIYVGKYL